MTISDIAATVTGERMMSKDTGGREPASCNEIARLAYCLFEARGRSDGHDVDDWLEAESPRYAPSPKCEPQPHGRRLLANSG
jgi:hypothetical protein